LDAWARIAGAVGAIALTAGVCLPQAEAAKPRHAVARAPHVEVDPASGFGSFTPAAADPRLAAAFARSGLGLGNAGGAFRFTPSGSNKRRAITVAIRARAVTKADAARALALTSADIAPSAYSLGLSVGWKHFALSGDVSKLDGGLLEDRHESADLGVSFTGKRWATKLDVAAARVTDSPLVGIDQSWSVGLGGTYMLTHNLDLSGGIRYKTQRDQFQSLLDDKRDSQAVYLGTTFRF
jgi:hypothetical protein